VNTLTAKERDIPLCVDLDGTLVQTDMLFESALQLIKRNPIYVLFMVLWLSRGKAVLKREIISRVTIDAKHLPFHLDVLNFVRESRQLRQTVLVTGSDQSMAEQVASATGVFDVVRGSDGVTNLTAHNKRDWLVEQFGEGGFDYIGNDTDDLAVWAVSRRSLAVANSEQIGQFAGVDFHQVFAAHKRDVWDYIGMMRVHQWLKNTLIFIPFLLDKTVHSWAAFATIVLCFFAMSLLASMTYIVNDMLDLQADRLNANKRERSLASGRMTLPAGVATALALAGLVLVLMFFLPAMFNVALMSYLVLTLLYSFHLKRRLILDVCMLAGLHTLRIVAGILAVGAQWSFWLLAFSMFVFFSLAIAKRVAELTNLKNAGRESPLGRAYRVADLPMMSSMGVSSGYISVLVVALFINSDKVQQNYTNPMVLWLLCPLLMYWMGRLWIIAARGDLHEDPIVFAVKDRLSMLIVSIMALVMAVAAFV